MPSENDDELLFGPENLKRLAEMLRDYAERYEQLAKEMETVSVGAVPAGGVSTIEDKAFKFLRGHINGLRARVEEKRDSLAFQYVAEKGEQFAEPLKKNTE